MARYFVPDHLPALHHEADALDRADVLRRVALDGDDVGELARLNLADLAFESEQTRGVGGRGAQSPGGSQPGLDQPLDLARVVAVQSRHRVRAGDDPHARL